jgi:hypothetical protein
MEGIKRMTRKKPDIQQIDRIAKEEGLTKGLNLPTNGGHSVKGVYSPLEVHHGPSATHLHF